MLGLFNKKKVKALVVVDVQNDFTPGGALAVPKGDEVVPVINKLLTEYDLVVATKDWHPKGHISFASRHPGTSVGDRVELESGTQRVWPDHCVQGTVGAEFAKGLTTNKFAKVFEKGVDPAVDSYSALFDNDQRRATGLGDWLKANKVEEVYIVGLATDYTVKYTALDCAKAGFKTFVIKEGCRAVNMAAGDEERSIREMQTAGVTVK
ncbi:MAG TPA: bifunctional nicotinamidase/pyrazinamidase [Verrucomicrobiae bacterium]